MSKSILSSSTSSRDSLVDTIRTRPLVRNGIGGAGNYQKSKSIPAAPPPPISMSTQSQTTTSFRSGIGGAGNKHAAGERPRATYDDELRRAAARRPNQTVARSGIGGAGNYNKSLGPAPSTELNAVQGEALPYGAIDVLSRKLSRVFSSKSSKESTSTSNSSKVSEKSSEVGYV